LRIGISQLRDSPQSDFRSIDFRQQLAGKEEGAEQGDELAPPHFSTSDAAVCCANIEHYPASKLRDEPGRCFAMEGSTTVTFGLAKAFATSQFGRATQRVAPGPIIAAALKAAGLLQS
jgi:hypothetical protein